MIRYYASEKLTETTSDKNSGLHTNAFGATITSHTFEDGIGTIEFDSEVTQIGGFAFYNCANVTKLVFPDTIVGGIGNSAFYGCSNLSELINLNLDSITSVGNYAFQYCKSLTSITIPNSVTSIGDSAFSGCKSLTSITIPNSVTSIGGNAFYDCYFTLSSFINNSSLDAEENNYWGAEVADIEIDGLYIKDNTVIYYNGTSTSITIPDSVTSIGSSAFGYCSAVTSITIPSSVTSIGNSAFQGCSALTSITIPSSVTSINFNAFQNCTSLTSITIPNSVTSILDYVFYGCSSLTSITIPDSVIAISQYAFSGCSSLTSITIPSSVNYINATAFQSCYFTSSNFINNSSLDAENNNYWGAKIIVPNNDGFYIGVDGVLYVYKGNATDVIIPDGVIGMGSLEAGLVFNSSTIRSITIPTSVTSIYSRSIYRSDSLTSITVLATTPPSIADHHGSYIFNDESQGECRIYVPAASISSYKTATGWSYNANDIYPIE